MSPPNPDADRKRISIAALVRSVRAHVSPPALLVIGFTVLLLAFHAWWLHRFRRGFPLDTDEAGYMRFGYEATSAVRADGLIGFWHALQSQTFFGPLLGLVTVPVHLLVGDSVSRTFLVQWPFFVLLIASVYGIGRRVSGAWLGALAVIVVVTVPFIVDFTRAYHFIIPSTALFTASLYALLRAEGFARRGWAVAWGAACGLTLLSRTMMIAFLPGILVSAVVLGARSGNRRTRLLNLGVGIGVTIGVAALWYVKSLPTVVTYLTRYGYGDRSALSEFASPFSLSYWTHEAAVAMHQSLLVPLTLLLMASMLVWVVVLIQRVRRQGARTTFRLMLRSELLVLAIPVLAGYMALSTTANDGLGFSVPLIPPLVLVAVAVLTRSRTPSVLLTRVLVAGFLAAAGLGLVSKSNLLPGLSARGVVYVPMVGHVPVWDSTSSIGRFVEASGFPLSVTGDLPRSHRGWLPASQRIASSILAREEPGTLPLVTFASREPLVNTNTLGFASRAFFDRPLAVRQLERPQTGGVPGTYRSQLEIPQPWTTGVSEYLLTSDPAPVEFPPALDQRAVERVAGAMGFRLIAKTSFPDGREARLWARPAGAA